MQTYRDCPFTVCQERQLSLIKSSGPSHPVISASPLLLNGLHSFMTTPRSMHGVGVTALVATGKVHGAAGRAQTQFRLFGEEELEV